MSLATNQATSGLYQGGGTSYAAPQVAGAAAVVWAAFPYFNNDQVRQAILGGAKDLGAAGVDNVFGEKNVYVYQGVGSYRENVRIETDGFWFTRSQPSGTRFRYTVLARNQSTSGRVRYKPGPNGHFVYLGFQPDQVALQREDEDDAGPSSRVVDHSDPHRPDRSSSYPSAY